MHSLDVSRLATNYDVDCSLDRLLRTLGRTVRRSEGMRGIITVCATLALYKGTMMKGNVHTVTKASLWSRRAHGDILFFLLPPYNGRCAEPP